MVDGKLRLSLRDAVVLTLENNSLVRMQETQVESSKFALLGAHAPFDPVLTSSVQHQQLDSRALQPTAGNRNSIHLQLHNAKRCSSTIRKLSRPARTYRPV